MHVTLTSVFAPFVRLALLYC